MKKKILALILASLMLLSVLASCKNGKNGANDSTNGSADGKGSANAKVLSLSDIEKQIKKKVGKSDNDGLVVMKVDGCDVTYSEYRYYYTNYVKQFSNYYGFDFQKEDDKAKMFDEYFNQAINMDALVTKLAKERKLGLTQEEFDTNVLSVYDSISEQFGDDMEKTLDETYSITKYYMLMNETIYNLYNKIFESFYGENGEKYEEIKEETLKYFTDNDYIRAKHILIKFPDVGDGEQLTDEQKTETRAKAEEVLTKVKNGEDFDALSNEYNEDPGVESNPDGYCFGKGQMVEAFETAAYALKEGEISDLVETEYGYHIIKRLPIAEGNIAETSDYQSKANEAFNAYIDEQLKKIEPAKPDEKLIQPILDEANAYLDNMRKQAAEGAANAESTDDATAENAQ